MIYVNTGPLLNPALALGQNLMDMNFHFDMWIYTLMPLGGSALALIFYEFVFVRSQEYLADEDSEEGSQSGLELDSDDGGKKSNKSSERGSQ